MYEFKSVEPSTVAVRVLPKNVHCGVHLNAIAIPEQCVLLGLLRKGCFVPVGEDPFIYAGDFILAVALHPMLVPALKVALKKTHSAHYLLSEIPSFGTTSPIQ